MHYIYDGLICDLRLDTELTWASFLQSVYEGKKPILSHTGTLGLNEAINVKLL